MTTPSALSKEASRYFFEGAATPPILGGDYCSAHFVHHKSAAAIA